jgi:hypothetical protein
MDVALKDEYQEYDAFFWYVATPPPEVACVHYSK